MPRVTEIGHSITVGQLVGGSEDGNIKCYLGLTSNPVLEIGEHRVSFIWDDLVKLAEDEIGEYLMKEELANGSSSEE